MLCKYGYCKVIFGDGILFLLLGILEYFISVGNFKIVDLLSDFMIKLIMFFLDDSLCLV